MRLFLLPIFCVLLLSACTPSDTPSDNKDRVEIPFKKEGTLDFEREGQVLLTIDIEIADDDSTRERGLMQRSSLPDKSGMLFLFPREDMLSFWMANTPIPLDLLFVNSDSVIVSIAKYTKPLSPQSVATEVPAQFVIEVEAGFVDSHGLIEGDRVRW